MPTLSNGITLLGAVKWRRNPGDRWHSGNAVRFLNDAEGTVELRDARGEKVLIANDSRFIKERKA